MPFAHPAQSPASAGQAQRAYVGRFAPTPSGALHFGSLVTATGSFLEARRYRGQWRLRIDDVDITRAAAGAAQGIIATLERFGFEWDGEIVWQSARTDAYHAAFEQLKAAGQVFPCTCTRREMADSALARDGSRLYPGTCRGGLPPGHSVRAWRVRAEGSVRFDDEVQGPQKEELASAVGDFILLRADGLFAYQLAAVVDDADGGITHVVRGADLLESTVRQVYLQQLLGLPRPRYAHLPVATNAAGEKLSKQTFPEAIDLMPPPAALWAALRFLGQQPPAQLARAPLAEVWQWALEHWQLAAVPRCSHAIAVDLPTTAKDADAPQ